jgi:hypothetical protein
VTPSNEAFYYAAYIITAAILAGYSLSLNWRRRRLREHGSAR